MHALRGLGPLRVWSLLVTVFGDLAPDGALNGPTLSAIMSEIGIKPEATRVALHRLRSDGWLQSHKNGRTSLHRLSEKGQNDSVAAHRRIYGTPEQMGRGAQVIVLPEAETTPDPTMFAPIGSRVFIGDQDAPPPAGAMLLTITDFPPWLGCQIETETHRIAYSALFNALSQIDADLPKGTALSPLKIAVLRVLIVHAWRRLALKHPDLPRSAHSPQWRGHACRQFVTRLLDRFPRPDLDQIEAP